MMFSSASLLRACDLLNVVSWIYHAVFILSNKLSVRVKDIFIYLVHAIIKVAKWAVK
jgi:hypothetical protein